MMTFSEQCCYAELRIFVLFGRMLKAEAYQLVDKS